MKKRESVGYRYIYFWVSCLTYRYLLTQERILQSEVDLDAISEICARVVKAAEKHNFPEAAQLRKIWNIK